MKSSALGQNRPLWLVLLLVVALGIFFRLYGLGERDLWTDEAWVALAVQQSSPAAVLQAGKSTPPLYLLTVWALVQRWGHSETILRLTSWAFGVGTLFLFWILARRLLKPGAAMAALTGVAISTRLVYFSKELKQYSADAFFTVLALVLLERIIHHQGRRGWLALTFALAVGMGYSHSLIFTIPIVALILWWRLPRERWRLLAAFGTLALVFAGYYRFFFQGQVDPELVYYWQEDFPDLTGLKALMLWFLSAWGRYLRYFWGDWGWMAGLGFLVVGLLTLFRNAQKRVVLYFLGPLGLTLAAAFLHRYPFMGHAGGNRLMLFSAPLLYLVVGVGVMAVVAWVWRQQRSWLKLVLLAGLLIWVDPVQVWQENLHPQANREEIQSLVKYLETHRQKGDVVYVYYFAIDPVKFYYQGPLEPVIWGRSCHDKSLCPPLESPPERLWLIFSHFDQPEEVEKFLRDLLGDNWTRQISLFRPGAALFYYTRRHS